MKRFQKLDIFPTPLAPNTVLNDDHLTPVPGGVEMITAAPHNTRIVRIIGINNRRK